MAAGLDTFQRGSGRRSVANAAACIDAQVAPLGAEDVSIDEAAERVAARDVVASIEVPPSDIAVFDGLAVRAEDTIGASTYNPLSFHILSCGNSLLPNTGMHVRSGDALPRGADAIVPQEHVEQSSSNAFEVIEPIGPGSGVQRRGSQFSPGMTLLPAGRMLGSVDVGLLAAAGVPEISVIRRPRVRAILAAVRPTSACEPLLNSLVRRDGATLELCHVEGHKSALHDSIRGDGADLTIVVGATPSDSDEAVAAIPSTADGLFRGVALIPGEMTVFGLIGRHPVFFLPTTLADCLWAYEFLAGRAVRRLAGRNPGLPHRTRVMTAARKIVSSIGTTEVRPVRFLSQNSVEPVISFAEAGLGATLRADGFVVVPDNSEGFSEGAALTVHVLRESSEGAPT